MKICDLRSAVTTRWLALLVGWVLAVPLAQSASAPADSPAFPLDTRLTEITASGTYSSGSGIYGDTATITITSNLANGAIFYSADGTTPSIGGPLTYTAPFTISVTKTIRALAVNLDTFETKAGEPLTVTIVPTYALALTTAGGGTVVATPAASRYLSGTVVSITATAATGWTWMNWTGGDVTGATAATTSVTMSEPRTAAAVFGTTLTTSVTGGGAVAVSPAASTYAYGSVVRLVPKPNEGSAFSIWGNASSGSANPLDFTVTVATRTISALFSTLSAGQVNVYGSVVGDGTVTVAPAKNVYTTGESVTLTAVPGAQQVFTGWSGGVTSAANPLVVTLATSQSVTANFLAGVAPVITTAPASQTVSAGASVTVTVVATGTLAPTYQWRKDGTAISGATNASYAIGAAVAGDAGAYTVTATNSLGTATSSAATLVVNRLSQTITFGALATKTYGDAAFAPGATASSGLGVTYASANTAVATVSGSTVTIVGAGTTTITASQAGDGIYNAATSVSQTLTVNKATAVVALGSLAVAYEGTAKSASATTAPTGLTVNFTYDGSAGAPTNAGSYAVVGTIANANYQGTAAGTLVIAKANQTITFGALANRAYGEAPFNLTATASSGLPVTYTPTIGGYYNESVVSLSGSTVTITGSGAVTIVANQAGNANYNPANELARTLTVAKATATVTLGDLLVTYDGTAKAARATTAPTGLTVNFTYDGNTGAPTNAGSYAVVGTIANANYQGTAAGTLVIAKTVIRVPLDYATIQAAVDAAVNGDTIVLARGVHAGGVDFKGKGLTLRSDYVGAVPTAADIAETIIEGGIPGMPVVQTNGLLSAVRKEIVGLTVRKGSLSGIDFRGTGRIAYVVSEDNLRGGFEVGHTPNYDEPAGAVIEVADCVLRRNGLGLAESYGSIRVLRTQAYDNIGDGLSLHEGYDEVFDSLVARNNGFGVRFNSRGSKLVNTTVASNLNSAVTVSRTIDISLPVIVANCILWGNGTSVSLLSSDVSAVLDYNCIQGGLAGIARPYDRLITYGTHNLTTSPLFVSPGNGDYRLWEDSKAIGAGGPLPAGVVGVRAAQPAGSALDLGAIEHVLGVPAAPAVRIFASSAITGGVNIFGGSAQVTIETGLTNCAIYYSTDGSEPAIGNSSLYGGPFAIDHSATLRALAVNLDDFSTVLSAPLSITVLPVYTLSATSPGGGTAAYSPVSAKYLQGTTVTVSATPDTGWSFIRWASDATGTTSTTTVVMDRDRTVQAVFGTTLASTVAGGGTVQVSPATGPYEYGSVVRLVPKPNTGAAFSLWGGAASGSSNPLAHTVTQAAKTISALFANLGSSQVNLYWDVTGSGAVSVSPQKNVYAVGESVTLTAVPGANQVFTGWSGGVTSVVNPLVVALATSQSVTANFRAGVVPVITDFSPKEGVVGSSLTITGTSFDLVPGNNAVYFGTVRATVTAATATALTVTVPVGAGYVPLTVAGLDGFSVAAATAFEAMTFGVVANKVYGAAAFGVSAAVNSGLPVGLSVVSGPASISGTTVTLTGAGDVTLRATRLATGSALAGAPVEQTFTVAKAAQTITLATLADKVYGAEAFLVTATASSGLVPALSIVSGPATLSGATLTVTGVGPVVVRASQAGNGNYNPAVSVERTFSVGVKEITVSGITVANKIYDGTTVAAVSVANAQLVGVLAGDTVGLATSAVSGMFETAGLGVGKRVNVTGLGLSGVDAGKYTLTAPVLTAAITGLPPSITTQPVSLASIPGAGATFTVGAAGSPTPSYQWYKGAGPIAGATGASYVISQVSTNDASQYKVVVTNPVGTAESNVVSLTVNIPPVIGTQPATAKTVSAGTAVDFIVVATGTPSPTYQWRKDGVAINGATASIYTIAAAGAVDGGTYTVVATNAGGFITSNPSVLTVSSFPVITQQPVARAVTQGSAATFSVAAVGSAPLTYEWRKDGVVIPGATGTSYTVASVQTSDASSYMVIVHNSLGSVSSNAAVLTVAVPVTITTAPANVTVAAGSPASFTVVVSGTAPFTYQWRKDGVGIVGASLATLTLPATSLADAGSYAVTVANAVSDVSSSGALLTITAPPVITIQPQALTVVAGAVASLTVVATGGPAPTYQWKKNGSPVAGATLATLTFAAAQAADAAAYTVEVVNSQGAVTSTAAALTVIAPPVITLQPVAQTANVGGSVVLAVAATGNATLTYQWRRGGTAISGATTATYRFLARASGDAGSYDVVIKAGGVAITTSTAVAFAVNDAPLFGPGLTGAYEIGVGEEITLAAASPLAAQSWRWYRNGQPIAGAAASTLVLTNVSRADAGWYQLQTTSATGAVSLSAAVFLQVRIPNQVIAFGANAAGQSSVPTAVTDALAVSAGYNHTLAIRSGGNVVGWGSNLYSQLSLPTKLGRSVQVAAGVAHSVALQSDGTVVAWGTGGATGSGVATVPASLANVVAIAAGRVHTLALKSDGTVVGWGAPSSGQELPPVGLRDVVAIAAGSEHSLALRADGTVVAWGNSSDGRIALPAGLANIVAVAAGAEHSLALRADGRVIAWGKADSGRTAVPADLTNVIAIAGGIAHSVALRADGTLVAWGAADQGQTAVPLGLGSVYELSAAGGFHTAVLRDKRNDAVPVILTSPENRTVPEGASLRLAATGNFGTAPLNVQWTRNGTAIPGANLSTYVVPEVTGAVAGTYQVSVSNYLGIATSGSAVVQVTVVAGGTPASIVVPPVSVSVLSGRATTLMVEAAGTPPLRYEWKRNGLTVTGATTSRLDLTNVTAEAAYTVAVSNSITTVESAPAQISVFTAQALLSAATSGYVEGTLVTLQTSLTFGGSLAGLGLQLALPAGWTFVSADDQAPIRPGAGAGGTLGWAWTTVPASPVTFSVVLRAAADSVGPRAVAGFAILRAGGGAYDLPFPALELPQVSKPRVVLQPASGLLALSGNAALTVGVSGAAPFTYVWTRNGQTLVDGGRISGAGTSMLTLTGATTVDAGSYQVTVSNSAGTVTSQAATLAVVDATASHALVGSGYIAGGAVTITNTLTYSGTAGSLGWQVLLPPGWTYVAGSGSEGDIKPFAGTTDLLEWAWITIPASPLQFTYTLRAPLDSAGDQTLAALVVFRQFGALQQFLAKPDPLVLTKMVAHSADTNRDGKISLLELTRVIELYNTRIGTIRTGCYKVDLAGEDGFSPDPARLKSAVVALVGYHSADPTFSGQLDLKSLTRVIQLYNYRSGSVRTGQYRVQSGTEDTEDGFASGPP